jgi:transposase-like protein
VVIELPPENVRRWTARRKAAVVNAVNLGEVTREEICRRYQISLEEFLSWQRDYESYGEHGLRSTCLQIYRRHEAGQAPERPAPTAAARMIDRYQSFG